MKKNITRVQLWWHENSNTLKLIQPDGRGWMCVALDDNPEDIWMDFERSIPNPHAKWALLGEL
jgi:hypothetical protein